MNGILLPPNELLTLYPAGGLHLNFFNGTLLPPKELLTLDPATPQEACISIFSEGKLHIVNGILLPPKEFLTLDRAGGLHLNHFLMFTDLWQYGLPETCVTFPNQAVEMFEKFTFLLQM